MLLSRNQGRRSDGDALEWLRRSASWRRLAAPQADLYDVEVVLTAAAMRASAPVPSRSAASPIAIELIYPDSELRAVAGDDFVDAEPSHPSIAEATDLLAAWPAGREHVERLIRRLHPAVDVRRPRVLPATTIVSASHSSERRFGTLWAAVNSPVGLAQSIVHELAHHKLRALGLSAGDARAIVANDPGDLFPSPLVAWPRPMSAVVHAHYALLHVLALDVALFASADVARDALARSAATHAAKLDQSARVIRRHAIVDAVGVSFMEGMWEWMESVLSQAVRHGLV